MRLAILATPRSGSTWVRMLLAGAYGCESLAAHSPEEVPWEALPDDVVLQLHERALSPLRTTLERHGFEAVAVARHPLDVLISILHFARHDPSPSRWLEDEPGDELALSQATPLDPEFIEYATGPRAQALLDLTCEWWTEEKTLRIRYEALCATPEEVLGSVIQRIGDASMPRRDVVAAHSFTRLQDSFPGNHFWQGSPGHWRRLLPSAVAKTIARAHRTTFVTLGYEVDADPQLDAETAKENWNGIARPRTTRPRDRLEAMRQTFARDLTHLRAERFALLAEIDRLRDELASASRPAAGEASSRDRSARFLPLSHGARRR